MEINAASVSAYQQASIQNEVAMAVAGKVQDSIELQGKNGAAVAGKYRHYCC